MTFISFLASHDDHNAQYLAECLSGLDGGGNDLGEVIGFLHATLAGSELALAEMEAAARWKEFRRAACIPQAGSVD